MELGFKSLGVTDNAKRNMKRAGATILLSTAVGGLGLLLITQRDIRDHFRRIEGQIERIDGHQKEHANQDPLTLVKEGPITTETYKNAAHALVFRLYQIFQESGLRFSSENLSSTQYELIRNSELEKNVRILVWLQLLRETRNQASERLDAEYEKKIAEPLPESRGSEVEDCDPCAAITKLLNDVDAYNKRISSMGAVLDGDKIFDDKLEELVRNLIENIEWIESERMVAAAHQEALTGQFYEPGSIAYAGLGNGFWGGLILAGLIFGQPIVSEIRRERRKRKDMERKERPRIKTAPVHAASMPTNGTASVKPRERVITPPIEPTPEERARKEEERARLGQERTERAAVVFTEIQAALSKTVRQEFVERILCLIKERFSHTNKALAEILENHERIRDFLKSNGWILKQLSEATWDDVLLTNGKPNGKVVSNIDTSNALKTLRSGVPTNKAELYDLLTCAGFSVRLHKERNAIFFSDATDPVRVGHDVFYLPNNEMTSAQIGKAINVCVEYLNTQGKLQITI
ncbi:hypothetical protein J4450_06740 [Candidatus Micrarchaeota archaeon]|nr:hypothetical protein [Candidatus Micrarchaeota archaeon]